MSAPLNMWAVYQDPADYPGKFVARRWAVLPGQPRWTDDVRVADTLDEVRAKIPPNMVRLPRSPSDEDQIVETWI